MSVVLDFFVKSTGTGEMNLSWLSRLADAVGYLRLSGFERRLWVRVHPASAAWPVHYAELWQESLCVPS